MLPTRLIDTDRQSRLDADAAADRFFNTGEQEALDAALGDIYPFSNSSNSEKSAVRSRDTQRSRTVRRAGALGVVVSLATFGMAVRSWNDSAALPETTTDGICTELVVENRDTTYPALEAADSISAAIARAPSLQDHDPRIVLAKMEEQNDIDLNNVHPGTRVRVCL